MSAASPVLLEGKQITKTFGHGSHAHQVLFDVNIQVCEGQCVAIIGGSGSGKSTLTRIVLGLDSPTSGEVLYQGTSIEGRSGRDQLQILREQSGIVYQNPFDALDPRWSVYRSVAEPLMLRKSRPSRDECDMRVRQALQQVALDPNEVMWRYPVDLSGGQAQRVAIARAIITHPRVILADEAMSAIDVAARLQILDAFAAIRAANPDMAMLMVSHDLGVVQHIADRIIVLHDGHIVEEGATEQIVHDPHDAYTRSLIAAATL